MKHKFPPGPPSAINGWSHLRTMQRDLLSTLTQWHQQYGDLVYLRIWPEHQVILFDPELARTLLIKHHDALIRWERGTEVFSTMQGRSVLVEEGAAWKAKRNAVQPEFAPKPVQDFVGQIASTTDSALQRWPTAGCRLDIEGELTTLTMRVIVRMLFNVTIEESKSNALNDAVHTLMVAANNELYWPVSAPMWMPWKARQKAAWETLHGFIREQVMARIAAPDFGQDLLGRLLAAYRPKDLTIRTAQPSTYPQSVHDECVTAFMAGHETSAATLVWWSWAMASHPHIQDQVRAEVLTVCGNSLPTQENLGQLEQVTRSLQETMRLYPAAPLLMTRRSTQPMTLGDYQFPARTMFVIPIYNMQRDSRWFENPTAFNPDRFGQGNSQNPRGAYMPFGVGPRVCLGQHLAMAEMKLVAAMILQRFTLNPISDESEPLPVLSVSLRPQKPLVLNLSMYP